MQASNEVMITVTMMMSEASVLTAFLDQVGSPAEAFTSSVVNGLYDALVEQGA